MTPERLHPPPVASLAQKSLHLAQQFRPRIRIELPGHCCFPYLAHRFHFFLQDSYFFSSRYNRAISASEIASARVVGAISAPVSAAFTTALS